MTRAYYIEKELSKQQILELYLNTIFIGGNDINGVALGAIYYFNKDVIDYYLEIELELFGLNIEGSEKNDYQNRKRLKLGVPKEILSFFRYNKGTGSDETSLTQIVESLDLSARELKDETFFMGRDGIYFRIV